MTVELVTGYAGEAHITAADDGWKNAGVVGSGMYVLDTGSQVSCAVSSNTAVVIGTGDIIMQGRHIRIQSQETVSIDNGAQSVNRNDIICMHYTRNTSTGVETAELAVIKGTATSGAATDPTIPSGNILSSAANAYMPLYRIPLTGINIGTPVKLFGDVLPTLETAGTGSVAASRLTGTIAAARIPGLAASKITSGTLDAARIPSLDPTKISGTLAASQIPNLAASKITSGTLDAARIPTLDAAKIGTGTLAAARIPSLDASKIGSGTLNADRIPSLDASKIASGTLAAARIPSLAASKITSGEFAAARIPTLDASKIGTGTLDAARIPPLDASKIGTGTLAAARIPNLAASKITSGTFEAARIPTLDASKIGTGTLGADRIPSLAASKITSGKLALGRMPYYTLYSGNGISGEVTLDDSAANYTYLEVFYRTDDYVFGSVKISAPDGRTFAMQNMFIDSAANMYVKVKNMKVSGDIISQSGFAGHMVLHDDATPTYAPSANEFYIYLVIGYK